MQYSFRLYALILKILKFIILTFSITKERLCNVLDKRHYAALNTKKLEKNLSYIRKISTC